MKFDLRIYALLSGIDPLRIYIYNEGLARFATHKYVAPSTNNCSDLFMHLTNYAINKNSKNFVKNKTVENDDIGHKRSLTFLLKYLEDLGHNSKALMDKIADIITKTICMVQPTLAHSIRTC